MAGGNPGQLPAAAPPDSDSDSDLESLRPRLHVIHSGHFMVSSLHSDDRHRAKLSDRSGAHPVGNIDPTLTRLFECMSLAYSGKLVSPKWKTFKGLRLLWSDKIRLNNAIWRAWYIQYAEKKKTPVCGFVTPLDGSEGYDHRKPEAVVLEGNYWKRRIEVVMKEYNKWRIYYKKRLRKLHNEGKPFQEQKGASSWRYSEKCTVYPRLEDVCRTEEDMLFDLDYFLMDISDTLFTTAHGPSTYNCPDNDYAGNADMIQPELATLQPSLDDFVDMPEFFGGPRLMTSQQFPLLVPQQHCFSGNIEESSTQPRPSIACHRIPEPQSSYSSQSQSCFSSPPLSSEFVSSAVPCATPGNELKTLPQYGFSTDSFNSRPQLSMQCISQNLHVQDQDLMFPPVSCPKHPFPGVTTDSTILNQSAGSSSHGDVYPVYSETSVHVDASNIFTMPKTRVTITSQKPPRSAPEDTTRSIPIFNPPHIAAKPDSSAQITLCGPPGPNMTTGGRLDSRSFRNIAPLVQTLVPPSTQCTLGFPPPPPIFLTPAFCAQSSVDVSDSSSLSCSPLPPKTERLSPTSACGGERRDSFSMPSAQTAKCWSKTERKVDSRRIMHISAEQKRRCNIKLGFDTLHSLVTTLHGQPNKLSKATTLQKTAEYICKLQQERAQLQEETQRLRCQIQELNDSINLCQQQLPASGVPVGHQRFHHMRQMFQAYVQTRTLQNWKFWLFSLIIRPLFDSFNRMVSTASMRELKETSLEWLEQHCSLPALRPTVPSSLCQLSTSTSILTDPTILPDQAVQAVTRGDNGDSVF